MLRLSLLTLFMCTVSVSAQETEVVTDGPHESKYENGKTESKGEYVDGKREHEWEYWWPNGKRRARGTYVGGAKHGEWTTWHEKGRLHSRGSYENGVRTGNWRVLNQDKSVDERRSGVYSFVDGEAADGSHRYRGAVLNGLKDGNWVYSWPAGSPMFCATYDVGIRAGEVFFFHRSGRLDLGWVSGHYFQERWMTPTDGALDWVVKLAPAAIAAVDVSWPSDEAAPDELALRGRAGVPAALGRLAACDLDTQNGREAARLLHEDVLTPIFGGSAWPWPADDDPEQVRLLVDRWASAWFLLGGADAAWENDFAEANRWMELDYEQTALGRPPLPGFVAGGQPGGTDASAGMIGIGVAGGKFGGRFGGRKRLRAAVGKSGEELLQASLNRLREEQAAAGSWSSADSVRTTSLALLAMLGDANTMHEGPFRENVYRGTRWLVEHQDRASGSFVTGEGPSLYTHALATLSLAEAVFFSRSPGPRRAVERAVEYLLARRLPDGSFPEEVGGDRGDVRTSALATVVLSTARDAGLEWKEEAALAAANWCLGKADPKDARAVGAAYFAGVASGLDPEENKRMQRLDKALSKLVPDDEEELDVLCSAAYAAYQAGGETWSTWKEPLNQALRNRSAPPADLEETALLALTLEVFFRYSRSGR